MDVPKPRQLKSGRWNVQIMVDGKRRSITKDSKKEVLSEARYLLSAYQTNRLSPDEIATHTSAGELIDQYIEQRKPLLSEVSVRDYKAVRRGRFKKYMNKPWAAVNWQRAIDEELASFSYNTVYNAWRIVKTAARYAGLNLNNINIRFPNDRNDTEHAYLNVEQMHQFLDAIKGEPLELACLFGLLSLRKSEILGVRKKDVDLKNNILHVRATTVYMGSEGELFREHTKTPGSRRDIPLSLNPRIIELVSQIKCDPDDVLVSNGVNTLYNYINKKCDQLGFERIGVHGLRHTFASICWEQEIPIEVTMLYGGWKTERIVRSIYQHLAEKKLNEYSAKLAQAFHRP